MPRSGNTFDWGSIGNWSNPQASEGFDITGWNTLRNDLKAELTRSLANDGTGSMTGQLKAAVGTVAAPGISFSTDAATGFYEISSGVWGFAVAGVLEYTFKSGALVADNNTSVVTSSELTTALAAIGAMTPRYAVMSINARSYTGTGATEVLTSAKVGTSWTTGETSGITASLANCTLTIAATGIYEVWYSSNTDFPGTATLKNLQLAIHKNGVQVTPTAHTATEIASLGNRYSQTASHYVSLAVADVLDLRANGTNTEVFVFTNVNWGARRIA